MSADEDRKLRVIACYNHMAQSSTMMLEAAQRGDWNAVIAGEKECATLVTELKGLGEITALEGDLREQKRALIRTILANDAAIRDLAEPRMKQLELKLQGPKNARKLALAYGATLRPY
jgi:flagellar protein FliT